MQVEALMNLAQLRKQGESRAIIVSATGVYRKTTDPENPLGEPITQVTQDAALSS